MKKINIYFSVDWEGRILEENNLSAFALFRQDFPHIPILQFLNAAYFTKTGANFENTKSLIESVILPIDEIGLHIHGWKSQFEAAGVQFRNFPSFSTGGEVLQSEGDIGHDVPISQYTAEELSAVIKHSKKSFSQCGWKTPTSFRSGGWTSKPNVLKALENQGFLGDFSAVPCELLEGKRKSNFLYDWLLPLWSDISPTSQPYALGKLMEWPNNGCLADYVTGEDMLNIFKKNWAEFIKSDRDEWFLSFGFHQETTEKFIGRIREAIFLIENFCQSNKISLSYPKLPLSTPSLC